MSRPEPQSFSMLGGSASLSQVSSSSRGMKAMGVTRMAVDAPPQRRPQANSPFMVTVSSHSRL